MDKFIIKSFTTPKYGNSISENEDAIVLSPLRNRGNFSYLCLAISDGATQTSFSNLWANLLVNEVVAERKTPSFKNLYDIIQNAGLKWQSEISTYNLPWHAEEKVKNGAFSSLLWIRLRFPDISKGSVGRIKSLAVGDSNLFIFRDDRLHLSFPIKKAEDFGNAPILISSLSSKNKILIDSVFFLEESILPGDELFVATDALAAFLLRRLEEDSSAYTQIKEDIILKANQNTLLETWTQVLRDTGQLKNDDTTFAWIKIMDFMDVLANADNSNAANN